MESGRGRVNWVWAGQVLAVLLVTGMMTGCASYGRAWKRALQEPAPEHGLAGAWEGYWVSAVNGHNERLRCLVTHQTNELYRGWFHARWKAKVFTLSAKYEVELKTEEKEGVFHFAGEADLGLLGLYQCVGEADGSRFFATYTNKYDHGTFRMTRPRGDTSP